MSGNLQCWEKDPFFSAAEQVQDSADRLESAFRAWIHAKSLFSDAQDDGSISFCKRELSTAFGIAKWQLEEFEKEVSTLILEPNVEDDAPQRRQQFVEAISNQLSSIRSTLLSSKDKRDSKILSSVSLCEKESDELAHFLCGSRVSASNMAVDTSSSYSKSDPKLTTSASLFSTSSGMDYTKALSGSVDECSSYQGTGASGNSNERCTSSETWKPKGNPACTDEVCIDVGNTESDVCAATRLLHGDCYESVGICIERANGHHQSAIVGGGLSCCLERASGHSRTLSVGTSARCCNDTGELRASHKHVPSTLPSKIWPSFLKTGLFVGSSGVSQRVLKRLKDGEADPMDICEMCDGDIEAKCSNFMCQDGKHYKGCLELPQFLQSSRKMGFSRQLVQRIIVLAVLGLLGWYLY